jgi:SRSO17 transposase
MTAQQIAELGPAFAAYLKRFRTCFPQKRTAAHLDTYCRGLLSELPRKSVEPIALEAGTAVRTLQEFLVTTQWQHEQARQTVQTDLAATLAQLPADPLGTIGVIDETSSRKWGDQTPGVQRQYLGCVGKVDNGIVTVHVGVAHGDFQALLDAELYLPKDWAADRERCSAAGIPEDIRYRSKWRIALDQLLRLHESGLRFDWLIFDAGYGSKVPFLWVLGLVGQKFVAEVPVNFRVRRSATDPSERADAHQPAAKTQRWRRFRLARRTQADQVWRAKSKRVWVAKRWHLLVTAVNERTGEVKYFVTNAVDEPLERLLRVAFRRAIIEQVFRLAKQEAGLMHYEGRHYIGLVRHLILALIVLGFVAQHTQRLRGEKPAGDGGASMPGVERTLWDSAAASAWGGQDRAHGRGHSIPPTAQCSGSTVAQEKAA